MLKNPFLLVSLLVSLGLGCTAAVMPTEDLGPADGRSDSGWVGTDTYEVNAIVRSTVRQAATGSWANLEQDAALQTQLVDLQLKFIKTTAESHGWRFNQLADSVMVERITREGDVVSIEYAAVVDMLGRLYREVPMLDEITPSSFPATVPVSPYAVGYSAISKCSEGDDSHTVSDTNFHYYFAPEAPDCPLEMVEAQLEITEVFERVKTYPEYDQLLQDLGEGRTGFTAALVPNRGDRDPMSRFDAHARMLERDLRLQGVDAEDGTYRRYEWTVAGGATIVIDLYDPTKIPWALGFAGSFREKLGTYTLVHYNGHSSYGTKHLLDEPESFSDAYQILMIHSCQSYAYYTRQIFRAKVTEEDPSGFALADVVATGKSSYPSGSPPTLGILLRSLMDGMNQVLAGQREQAPDWLTIAADISNATYGDIMYGIAGVRTNRWEP